MFTRGKFSEFADLWTLKFNKSSLEKQYMTHKERVIEHSHAGRFLACSATILSIGFFFFIARGHYNRGEYYLAFANVLTMMVGDLGIVAEFMVQRYTKLKKARGFFCSAGLFFCCTFYATRILPSPSLLPGYASPFLI
ncbi:MAG: hypothetical protein P4M11_00880 [Candidatus Pacebacteria bacterium]|nr:hypothetical protein [Candidatus Paceibacterota bacterium]